MDYGWLKLEVDREGLLWELQTWGGNYGNNPKGGSERVNRTKLIGAKL